MNVIKELAIVIATTIVGASIGYAIGCKGACEKRAMMQRLNTVPMIWEEREIEPVRD